MYRVYTKHLISHKNGIPALVATATTTATTAAVCASYHDGCNAAVTMATDARHQRWRWGQRPNAQDRTYWSTPLASTPTDQPPPTTDPSTWAAERCIGVIWSRVKGGKTSLSIRKPNGISFDNARRRSCRPMPANCYLDKFHLSLSLSFRIDRILLRGELSLDSNGYALMRID